MKPSCFTRSLPAAITILLLLTIFAAPCLTLAQESKEEPLPAPSILINPDIYYPLDEILYLEGRGVQNSLIQIQFQKQGAKPLRFSAKTDANGEWVLAEKVPLEAGDWEVRARIIESQERVSEWSNPRVFKVIVSGITIGGVNIKFAALTLIIVILLMLGIATTWYFLARVHRLRSQLFSKQIREAQESVRGGLAELRSDLIDELRILESSGLPMTQEARMRKEHILRELDALKEKMEREMKNIEEKM